MTEIPGGVGDGPNEPRPAQWAIDFDYGCRLESIGSDLRRTALARRCSVPLGEIEPSPKCSRDKGHDGDHECNMSRDFDGARQPSAASPSDLARAAAAELDVVVPAWRSERRDPPIADNASLVRILTRVLTAAQGGLTAAEAAAAVAARIEVRRSPLTVEVGVMERIAERASTPDPATATVVSVAAASLFSDLDDRERILLASFHLPLESAADQLVLRRSQTADLRQRVVRRMQAALGIQFDKEGKPEGGDEEAVLTAALVRDLCAAWAEGRI